MKKRWSFTRYLVTMLLVGTVYYGVQGLDTLSRRDASYWAIASTEHTGDYWSDWQTQQTRYWSQVRRGIFGWAYEHGLWRDWRTHPRLACADCKTAHPDAAALAVAVWPKNWTLAVAGRAQFYAGTLNSDGTTECMVPAPMPDTDNSSDLVAGCDSAIARLPAQDSTIRHVRFTWSPLFTGPTTDPFDSLTYRVVVATDSGPVVFDTAVAHPDSVFIWTDGERGADYRVRVYQWALLGADTVTSELSDAVLFNYPINLPLLLQLAPVRVDTLPAN